MKIKTITPESLAALFHGTYERRAEDFGYITKEETRTFNRDSPNGKLMIAVCGDVLKYLKSKKNETV